ncbi:hypothetical protein [Geotoga petraea]|uniref:Uncharacterized protein n=1 Tax=Geotoga petraea TaxID=28234 RepID=A0A1G6NTH4_9BACT|nr:hypothetical protein [Geotoga petraea]TGG85903.1 hypothetical protein E4650_10150 [Geotoga petraea]SDC71129.1 hypothetical protein SAMN04488588_1655 [Geotoga petraea]
MKIIKPLVEQNTNDRVLSLITQTLIVLFFYFYDKKHVLKYAVDNDIAYSFLFLFSVFTVIYTFSDQVKKEFGIISLMGTMLLMGNVFLLLIIPILSGKFIMALIYIALFVLFDPIFYYRVIKIQIIKSEITYEKINEKYEKMMKTFSKNNFGKQLKLPTEILVQLIKILLITYAFYKNIDLMYIIYYLIILILISVSIFRDKKINVIKLINVVINTLVIYSIVSLI